MMRKYYRILLGDADWRSYSPNETISVSADYIESVGGIYGNIDWNAFETVQMLEPHVIDWSIEYV